MKKVLMAIAICAMLGVVVNAHADTSAVATTQVFLDVVANIGLRPLISIADGGDIQAGQEAILNLPFRVDANTQDITMSAFVSNLYKGDDPSNPTAPPIRPSRLAAVGMVPENGGEVGGGLDEIAQYQLEGSVDGFLGLLTEAIQLESSDPGHFSQIVVVTPTWITIFDEQPMGTYSGLVQVTAATLLRGGTGG